MWGAAGDTQRPQVMPEAGMPAWEGVTLPAKATKAPRRVALARVTHSSGCSEPAPFRAPR